MVMVSSAKDIYFLKGMSSLTSLNKILNLKYLSNIPSDPTLYLSINDQLVCIVSIPLLWPGD